MFNFLKRDTGDVLVSSREEKLDGAILELEKDVGLKIDEDIVLSIPSIAQCIELIGSMIASTPIRLLQKGKNGIDEIENDNRVYSLNYASGNNITGYQLKKKLVADYLIYGNAYAYIDKSAMGFNELYYISPINVSCFIDNPIAIKKNTSIMVNGTRYEPHRFLKLVKDSEDGVVGRGLMDVCKTQIEGLYHALEVERLVNSSGGLRSGILGAEKPLTQKSMQHLRHQFEETYSKGTNRIIYLNSGVNFQDTTLSLKDLQLVENKENNTKQIYRYFHIPLSIFDGGARTDYDKDYLVTFALIPIMKAIESALNNDLLLETEKGKKYFAFDLRELAKGSALQRYKAYAEAVKGRWLTPSEVRELEDREPIDGLDVILFNLSDVLYNQSNGTFFTPNTKDISNGVDKAEDKGEIKEIKEIKEKGKEKIIDAEQFNNTVKGEQHNN